MYKVYLKKKTDHGSEVFDKTSTPSRDAALAAFRELRSRTELEGLPFAAVLSHKNKHLYYHRFDVAPEHKDYVKEDI